MLLTRQAAPVEVEGPRRSRHRKPPNSAGRPAELAVHRPCRQRPPDLLLRRNPSRDVWGGCGPSGARRRVNPAWPWGSGNERSSPAGFSGDDRFAGWVDPGHRPDRSRQDDDPLRGHPDHQSDRQEDPDRRGSDRVRNSQGESEAGQCKPILRGIRSRLHAPKPGCPHDWGDPRRRNRERGPELDGSNGCTPLGVGLWGGKDISVPVRRGG